MKSLQIVLMALIALVAAVASKRGLLARVGLAAALAVSLLWMGGHGAQAGSFNPTATWSVANTVADTPSDITLDVEIPEGDVLYSLAISFWPTDWQITPSSEVGLGVQRGTVDAVAGMGLLNSPCNTPVPMYWDTSLNATTDKSQTVTHEDGFEDSNGDGNIDFIDMYPDFNDRILGPAQPFMREAGLADLAGMKILSQFLYYEPGATIAGQAQDPTLGYPVVGLVADIGDPEDVPDPSIAARCTPFTATVVSFGTAEDGTVLLKTPKEAGTYTFSYLYVGQRDADDDGHENTLDPCPLTADADWDPRAASAVGPGDADGDGLPSSCDPDDNDPNNDEDGDEYLNRADNCPLVANGVAEDNQGDSDFDGIGDACDPNPDDAESEGEAPESLLSQDVTITEAAPAVETPTPTVAPPATPVATPTPVVTPAASPTPVIAPPPTGAGSASGGSWPWWPFAVAGAAAGAAGVLLAYQGRRAKP